jgi:isopenicillin-N epimerase
MVSAPLPPCDIDRLKARLYDEFRIEVPLLRWRNQPLIRVSFQGYNDEADLDALLTALQQALPR